MALRIIYERQHLRLSLSVAIWHIGSAMLPHALLLICLVAAGVYADCDDTIFHPCLNQLNIDLNLTDPQPYNNPTLFRNKVELFYQNSPTKGLRTVCKAFRAFKTCMKSDYQQCINPGNFVSVGVTPYNAYIFVSTFNTMHYTCGAGFQTYLSNPSCMIDAWSGAHAEQLNACRFKFEKVSDAQADNACVQANQYLDCWEQEFQSACGNNARDTQFWGCEYARINSFTRFPACNTRCVLPYNGGIIG